MNNESKVCPLEVIAYYSAQHGDPEDFAQARATMAELVDAAKAALVHVSCVGFPTNAEGGYDKNGAEWNFSDACPNPEDANELKQARMVLAAALAKFGDAP